MKEFLGDEFLLQTNAASRLYHDYAEGVPIFDYHCHLPPAEVADNIQYRNLSHVWLGGDHYKWRILRAEGVEESYITGDADDYEKFQRWAEVIPRTIGNPMYHWTHLELRRYFDVSEILSPASADSIYQQCNEKLSTDAFRARGLMEMMNVRAVCTTDDPTDSLEHHQRIAGDDTFKIPVVPAFRPDKAFGSENADLFNDWVDALASATGIDIEDLVTFIDALENRVDFFHSYGCRLSDHGIEAPFAEECGEEEAESLFSRVRSGISLSSLQARKLNTVIFLELGRMYYEHDWTMQIHMGALRNNNTRMFSQIGADTGFDAIGDAEIARPLSQFLDSLNAAGILPKTILYVLNPRDNDVVAAMMGCFQGDGVRARVQFGTAWWFNDQIDGMEKQMVSLANLGLLAGFLGMVTDSRSFLSYPRHEYFRRILCNLMGGWMERGEAPSDFEHIGGIVKEICFGNAKNHFGIPVA